MILDTDITLAEYQFNCHVSDSEGTDNDMSLNEISSFLIY